MGDKSLIRIPPFDVWKRRKFLVLHMETPVLSVESNLKLAKLPFIGLPYDEANVEKDIKDHLDDTFGVIITGSRNVNGELPGLPDVLLDSKLPKLGLCYGAEILAQHLGGSITKCNPPMGEFSNVTAELKPSVLFQGYDNSEKAMVKMEHSYMIDSLPKDCKIIASTKKTPIAGFECKRKNIFGLQFHPEKGWLGDIVFKNFYKFCDKRVHKK
jgi:GMP synthase-like glutamine amidotransferase